MNKLSKTADCATPAHLQDVEGVEENEDSYVPVHKCMRCKQVCTVVEDSFVHKFGTTKFLASECCGAPVAMVKDSGR